MNTKQNNEELAKKLCAAASSVVSLMGKHDVPFPMDEYEVMVMEPSGASRTTGKIESQAKPAFHILNHELVNKVKEEPSVMELSSFVDSFIQKESEPLTNGVPEQDHGWRLLTHYFNLTGKFDVNENIANKICQDFIKDLTDSEATVISTYLVTGIDTSEEFNLSEEVTFRRITNEDINTHGRGTNSGWDTRTRPWLSRSDWICEVECQSPKDTMEVFNGHSKRLERIVGALNLSIQGRATFTLIAHNWKSPFLNHGIISGGRLVTTSGIGGSGIKLDQDDIQIFKSIFAKLESLETDENFRHLKLPFRRLRIATTRIEKEDQIIDHVIGLESLLAKDSDHLETTHRFRLRGAALLPESFGNPRDRIDFMNKLYALRSDIVHGAAGETQINEYLPRAEEALRAIFLWYLDNTETKGKVEDIIRALDESMVIGGSNWTQGDSKDIPQHSEDSRDPNLGN